MTFAATAVYVDDVRSVLDFYHRAFGFEIRHCDEKLGYGELQTGQTLLAFVSHELGAKTLPGGYRRLDTRDPPVGMYIAFLTPDLPAAFAKAIDAGAGAVAGPKTMPWGRSSRMSGASRGRSSSCAVRSANRICDHA
jgi:predicted enzyme related to lactoylglutathione lyase